MLDFSEFLNSTEGEATLLCPNGQQKHFPRAVYEVLVSITNSIAKGRAVAVTPIDTTLTTQEAADFLEFSRPTLIKLLEKGEIPYEKMPNSRHRRLLLTDVIDFQKKHRRHQDEILDFLVEDAEEAGLYKTHRSQ